MEKQESSLESIIVLTDPVDSSNQLPQIECLCHDDYLSSGHNTISIEQENKNLRALLNMCQVQNFQLRSKLHKQEKMDAFVDIESACLVEKIEKNLTEANRIFNSQDQLKNSMQYLVKNLWSSVAFSLSDEKLICLTRAKNELLDKLEKNEQKCQFNVDYILQQFEILKSNNLKLKNKLEEQKIIINSLTELSSKKKSIEKPIFRNYSSNYLNLFLKKNSQDLIEFLKSEIFDQKIFYRQKMIPIVNDSLFSEYENEKIISDHVNEFYKYEDLISKIKYDKTCSHIGLVIKFEHIIERIFSAQDWSTDNNQTQNLNIKPKNSKVINWINKALVKINLSKFSSQSESIVHNIYSSLYKLFGLTTIFDDESMQELGGDAIDRLLLPVLESSSIIFDIFVTDNYHILNQELNFKTTLVLTSAANDVEKNLISFLNIYIKVYKIIFHKSVEKKLKKHQIGPNGENILNFLSYLELLKDLTVLVCSSLTRKFETYEPHFHMMNNQKNSPENTWFMRLKKNIFNATQPDISLLKSIEEEFVDLIFNCSYSLFLTTLDFTKKNNVPIAKFAIYYFSDCFSPKVLDSGSTLPLENSSLGFYSDVD